MNDVIRLLEEIKGIVETESEMHEDCTDNDCVDFAGEHSGEECVMKAATLAREALNLLYSRHAATAWTTGDVRSLAEEHNLPLPDDIDNWLVDNEKHIQAAMIAAGNTAIETLLSELED